MHCCAVVNCAYLVESSIEDYPVCALHDAPQVRGILDLLQRPGSYWLEDGRPIVLPCGDLTPDDFVLRPALSISMRAEDDPRMALIPLTPTRMVLPRYDLTISDYLGR